MKYVLDVHTHTLVSGHAFNTIMEMAHAAGESGLELLGISEHGMSMPGTCHEFYFQNLRIIDRNAYAVPLLFGAEVNIMDENGGLDMSSGLISALDYAIASLHPPCVRFLNKEEATRTIIKVIKNPNIHIIGHPDDGRYPLDYDAVARAAKEYHTLLEVNNSSLMPTSFRPNARENYMEMLYACEKYKTEIILNSDAHVDTLVGRHDYSYELIRETGFPEELIINNSVDRFKSWLCNSV